MTQYPSIDSKQRLTVIDLLTMKLKGEKISCLTAYDASFSAILDDAGIDVILVGDSLGMVIQGHASTLRVSMRDMVYHTRCVTRARQRALVIADFPFMADTTSDIAAKNAARLIQEGCAQMVKLEGAKIAIIRFLVDQGVPVCGHVGLLPQSINLLGRYKLQGKEDADAAKILEDAKQIEQAGASMLVLECIPAQLAKEITEQLNIPVIGIGAGVNCDGQVLVLYDLLGIVTGRRPRFTRNYMQQAENIREAVKAYISDVKNGVFPAQEHSY
jgi:3-methyl-2-oxobutanoate hydroxymethyltransferase